MEWLTESLSGCSAISYPRPRVRWSSLWVQNSLRKLTVRTITTPVLGPVQTVRLADVLFAALQAGDEDAAWKFQWEHPRFRGKSVADVKATKLGHDDAKLVVARDYSFGDWAELETFT